MINNFDMLDIELLKKSSCSARSTCDTLFTSTGLTPKVKDCRYYIDDVDNNTDVFCTCFFNNFNERSVL